MIYALIVMGLTALVLIVGLVLMVTGGKLNKKFSTKLMSLRVILQGIAIVVLACAYFFSQHSK